MKSDSQTAKAKVIDSPKLFFRTPNALQVDPRAKSVRMESFALGGAENIVVCAFSNRANISLNDASDLLVYGDGTPALTISGTAGKVLSALTSGHGLTLSSPSRISETTLSFEVSALNKPSVDPELCVSGQISRQVAISALGVDLGVVKAPVNMGKK